MLGDRIRTVRGKRSREDFAKEIGVHAQTLGRYENGERTPDAEFIARFCDRLKINANWLLLNVGQMSLSQRLEREGRKYPPLIESLVDELSKERETSRELIAENKDLMAENRDLHILLIKTKSRADPSDESDLKVQKSA